MRIVIRSKQRARYFKKTIFQNPDAPDINHILERFDAIHIRSYTVFRSGQFCVENEQAGFHDTNYYIVNQSYNYPALSWRTVPANPVRYIELLIFYD
jgi:hypothetical protein